MSDIGAAFRPPVFGKLDGRTKEARLLRDVRSELVEHLGGNPSATQRKLVEIAARLTLVVATADAKRACGVPFTAEENTAYARSCSALRETLRDLGTHGAGAAR